MQTYTIGETVKKVGLPAKTIRFYEEQGVLPQPVRLANGYRAYTEELVEQLKALKYARDLGLPLSEIKKLMKGCENGDCEHSHEYIESLIDAYSSQLTVRIAEMQTLRHKLKDLKNRITHDCKPGEAYCCNILTQLTKGGETHGR